MFLGAALVFVVAALDHATSNALSLAAFYLFPILLVGRNCGRGWALVFAVASIAAEVAQATLQEIPYLKPTHLYIAYANVLLEYLIVVLLTGMLRKLYEQERYTARIDVLTGARNRKGFEETLAGEIVRHQRKGIAFCLAYIDCDHFKQINDNYGHAEGDRLLKAIADVSIETLRRGDAVGRIGGDEFAIILPETGKTEALFVVDKLQHKLGNGDSRAPLTREFQHRSRSFRQASRQRDHRHGVRRSPDVRGEKNIEEIHRLERVRRPGELADNLGNPHARCRG